MTAPEDLAPAGPSTLPGRTARWRRIAARIVLLVAGVVTLACVALFVGMRVNDARIDNNLGTATATALSVSPLRTGIEFVDGLGQTVRPPSGVLYPGLLRVGQKFVVEYSVVDPTVVRVAGRTAAVGDLVIGLTVLISWVVAVALWWLLRHFAGFRRRAATPASPPDPAASTP